MKNLKLILPIFIALLLANSSFSQSKFYGKVTKVIDGRTLIVEPQAKVQIRIQLQYIEVPETEQKLHGVVKNHLSNLVLNKTVEFRPKNINDTSQPIGQILLNGVDVSQQMIRDGAAWYSVPEKNLQSEVESKVYQNNQILARNEKRGVWSIPGLKPAWEFRAEKEQKRKLEEKAKLEALEKKRPKLKAKSSTKNANADVKIWANVTKMGHIIDSGIISRMEKTPKGLEPISGYETLHHRNYVSTPISIFKFKSKTETHKLLGRLVYYTQNHDPNQPQSYWGLVILSPDHWEKFASVENFAVFVNSKEIALGQASRRMVETPDGKFEVLSYLLSNKQVKSLKNAKTIKVKAGKYSGNLSKVFMKKIELLLNKKLK